VEKITTGNSDIHDQSPYGRVYANDLALKDMAAKPRLGFTVGAAIVRERLSEADSPKPNLIAAMVKGKKGSNPKANDWEFLILDGSATRILHREKRGVCVECHSSQRSGDFVFGGDYGSEPGRR